MWIYQTPIGLLKIVRERDGICYFAFDRDPTYWTGHANPQVVADDVYCHATGCSAWDDSPISGPTDLSKWDYRPV